MFLMLRVIERIITCILTNQISVCHDIQYIKSILIIVCMWFFNFLLTTLFLKCCMKYNVQIYINLIFNLHLFQIPSPACFHGLFYREKDCKENGGTRKFGQRGKSKITFLDAFINQFKKPMLIEEEICQLILMLNSLSMTLHF